MGTLFKRSFIFKPITTLYKIGYGKMMNLYLKLLTRRNYLFAQKDSTIRQLKEVNIRGINDHAIMQSPAAVQLISRKTLDT